MTAPGKIRHAGVAMPIVRINDVFEKVLVLNLERRPERLAAVAAQLRHFGIRFERFAAIDGDQPGVARQWQAHMREPLVRAPSEARPVTSYREFYLDYDSERARVAFIEGTHGRKGLSTPGAFGLLLSMSAIVERALADGWASLLVLEDDVLLHKDTPALFDRFVAQAPPDWVILQLGAMQLHWEPDWITWHSANLYRCHGSSIGAHAYGIRKEALPLLRGACHARTLPFDIGALHTVKRKFDARCFTMAPNLAIQDAADSDIGMSTLFFREARKADNIYRWHLPDYGLHAIDASRTGGSVAAPGAPDVDHAVMKTSAGQRISRLLASIAARVERVRGRPELPPPATTSGAGAPDRHGQAGSQRGSPEPLQPFGDERPEARTIAVVVVGLERAELEQTVNTIANMGAGLRMVPVVITDSDAFELFRDRKVVVEYLPPLKQRAAFADDLDWGLYRLRRLALLRRKWQPSRIVAFGPTASALVRDWAASPFEDASIAAMISAPATPATAGEGERG